MNLAHQALQQRVPAVGPDFTGISVMVVAVVSNSELSGVPRHAANLVLCLLLQPAISTVHLVIAPWQSLALRSVLPPENRRFRIHEVHAGSSSIRRNLWFLRHLPALARTLGVGIVHLAYPLPVRRNAFDCPIVVTLHDLYPYDIPSNFGFLKVFFNRAILQHCLHSVQAVACVSESTLERLDMYAPIIALQKASMIYNAIDTGAPGSHEVPESEWQQDRFLLCVAQHRRNKNVVLAMEVFERLHSAGDLAAGTRLIVVGNDGPETSRIHRFIRRSGLAGKVILLRGLSDAALGWCYAHCELLLAPSSIEGFGYPILEAMLHHCRVVCSDIPAFREVGGAYCHYAALQPNPREAFVAAARSAMRSHKFRPAPLDRFCHSRVSEAYIRLYIRLRQDDALPGSFQVCNEVSTLAGGTQ